MKPKCQEPRPNLTSQSAWTQLYEGWAAARAGEALDVTMGPHWVQGWQWFHSPDVQTKMLRVGLLN